MFCILTRCFEKGSLCLAQPVGLAKATDTLPELDADFLPRRYGKYIRPFERRPGYRFVYSSSCQ